MFDKAISVCIFGLQDNSNGEWVSILNLFVFFLCLLIMLMQLYLFKFSIHEEFKSKFNIIWSYMSYYFSEFVFFFRKISNSKISFVFIHSKDYMPNLMKFNWYLRSVLWWVHRQLKHFYSRAQYIKFRGTVRSKTILKVG